MIRTLAIAAILMAGFTTFSQTTINFCTAVDKEYCYFNNKQFISPIDSTQALIFMLAKNPKGFGTTNLVFKIYKVDAAGKETLSNVIEQPVEGNWDWAWKSYLFPTPGKYNIKLFNQSNNLITSNSFELILPKKK